MKLELPKLNHQSSVVSRPSSVFRSTNVENIRQITPFYAKQTQFNPKQTQFKANSNPILETRIVSNVNLGKYLLPLKYKFQHPFLIKSLPKIAEKREIMAFTTLKRPKNHEKARKNQSGKEVSNVLELI